MSVMVDHNYPTTDSLTTVASNGDPIAGVSVKIFTLAAFQAFQTDTWVGSTTTDIDGHWLDPINLPDAQTWVVYFFKYSEYGPAHVEITT
jgi:hypothetical protein